MFLNSIIKTNSVDIVFFIICAVIIGVAVGMYFLIPVIQHKKYEERRQRLREREEAFYASRKASNAVESSNLDEDLFKLNEGLFKTDAINEASSDEVVETPSSEN